MYKAFIISLSLVLAVCNKTMGQAAKTSFSSFGLGRYSNRALATNQAMGGAGIGMPSYLHINPLNPALLVFNQLTLIEAGFVGEQRVLKNNTTSEQSSGFNLGYFSWAFPIKPRKWTTGMGLSPYTYVNYKIYYIKPLEGESDNIQGVENSGNGGLNELYWSNGIRLHKNIAVGLKAVYFFGAISKRTALSLPNSKQLIKYTANTLDRQSLSGFGASAGIFFQLDSLLRSKNYQFNVGVVYNTNAYLQTTLYSRIEQRDIININDSTVLVNRTGKNIIDPQSIGVGMSFGNGKTWLAGVDFSYSISSGSSNIKSSFEEIQDSWKVALGGKFMPSSLTGNSYFKHITYRIGFFFEKTPYTLTKNKIDDLGMSIGLSLPIQRVSTVTLTGIIGQQGNLVLNGVSETYFQLYCGVTFGDRWFIKRKFD